MIQPTIIKRNVLTKAVVLAGLWLTMSTMQAKAADLLVEVTDAKGQLLTDAVVYLESDKFKKTTAVKSAEIAQKGKKFHPLVTVVQTGTSVNFPNQDSVRHHVYSFSPAKKFELKLYSGVPAAPVLFDKAGTAVLGCNIHDTMLAYVHVVDSPYFAKTDTTGVASLQSVPDGQYQLRIWHYALKQENAVHTQTIQWPDAKKWSIKLDINSSLLVGQP